LYRGPFLGNTYSEWAEDKRRQTEDAYLKALTALAKLYSDIGQHSLSITALEKYLAADPYQDDVHCQLIEQHLAMNDEAAASRVYKKYHETIASELGSPPSSRMNALRRRLAATR
jgi:DNA-binding SARP family transcriptional activator